MRVPRGSSLSRFGLPSGVRTAWLQLVTFLLAGGLAGCLVAPEYRVSSDMRELGSPGEPGGLPVESTLPDRSSCEILGKVWIFKWAPAFTPVSEEYVFEGLAVPAVALGADRVVGAQTSTMCALEGSITTLGDDIGETDGLARWASGLAVRTRSDATSAAPPNLLLSLPPLVGVAEDSPLDSLLRRSIQAVMELKGYYC